MHSSIVKDWFGSRFKELSPEQQRLHLNGGSLSGHVDVQFGQGLARFIGARLARKLSIPAEGRMPLTVEISHDKSTLHWSRIFNKTARVTSEFKPVDSITGGYWVEDTGPLRMILTVDVIDGGWYWRCLRFPFTGVPLPSWIFPESKAYKRIVDGRYQFFVGFYAPFFGRLLTYEGLLDIDYDH